MSKNITGRAIITVDGKRLKTGKRRHPQPGRRQSFIHDRRRRSARLPGRGRRASLECSVYHNKDTSLRELSDITGATVLFETDTGKQFILRDAFTTEPAALNSSDGTVGLNMEAISCDEV
ncbi:phage tail tube protein [Thiohalophilus sp.]|uniref:phage tail tube protein n=1 Tax=Thiohalophilus sp. TaxID=3028392 RepID=UPI002ACEFE80|nr:phage tail tube protein [Thiohalophilus sp.]MDZ7804339.1 phage tail tube protein [Thiohalophilus sp.]